MKKIPMGSEDIEKLYDELYRMKEKLERVLVLLDDKFTETVIAEKAADFSCQKQKEETAENLHTADALIRKYYAEEFK